MKTKILSLAIAALSFSSFSSFAQASGNTQTCPRQAGCPVAMVGKTDKVYNPFEGLNLSADQKSKLEALKADRQKNCEERRKASRDNRKARLEQIKAILTPDQYVAYLENIAVSRHDGHIGMRHDGRKGHRGHKGQRPQRDNRQAPAVKS